MAVLLVWLGLYALDDELVALLAQVRGLEHGPAGEVVDDLIDTRGLAPRAELEAGWGAHSGTTRTKSPNLPIPSIARPHREQS